MLFSAIIHLTSKCNILPIHNITKSVIFGLLYWLSVLPRLNSRYRVHLYLFLFFHCHFPLRYFNNVYIMGLTMKMDTWGFEPQASALQTPRSSIWATRPLSLLFHIFIQITQVIWVHVYTVYRDSLCLCFFLYLILWRLFGSLKWPPIKSLSRFFVRRWSSRRFPYGYLVTT